MLQSGGVVRFKHTAWEATSMEFQCTGEIPFWDVTWHSIGARMQIVNI